MWTSSDLDVAPLVHALQQIIHHQAPDVAAPRGRVRPRGQRALGHHGAEGLAQPLDVFGKGGAGAERRTRALPERRRHSPAACVQARYCVYGCMYTRTHTHTHTHTHTRCTIHYTLHTTHRAWRGAANASPPAACPAPSRNGADVACCCGCAGVPFLVCWIAGWRSEVLAFPFRGSLLSAPFRSGLP